MKNYFNSRWIINILLAYVCLCTVVTTPAFALDPNQPADSNNSLISTKAGTKSPEQLDSRTTQTGTATSNRKNSTDTPKRELSSFFKVGIGINIAMILTFAYWFIGQWRQQK